MAAAHDWFDLRSEKSAERAAWSTMVVAYLLNWYPLPSQTALRREMAAIEALGVRVHRYSLRRYQGELVDVDDRNDRARTRSMLDIGPFGMAGAAIRVMAGRPVRFARALAAWIRLGRADDRGLLRTFLYLLESCVLLEWLEALKATHLHTHYATNSATSAMFCRILGGPPYSFTMHGPEEFDDPVGLSLREKIQRSAFTVAISEFTRSQLYRWADYTDWGKIHVVRVGVSSMFLEHPLTPVPDTPRLVCIGRIVEQKGQAVLIEAAARLRDSGRVFELVMVGDGPMRGQIERLIDDLDLRSYVRITGYLSNQDVRDELLRARALVLPSFAEGLPGVFFEAMALGRPVVSTYIAAHPELVKPGVNGWLVPAGAVELLEDAMEEALTLDSAVLTQMGRAGAARVAELHNPLIQARQLLRLFERYSGHALAEPWDAHPVVSGEESGS